MTDATHIVLGQKLEYAKTGSLIPPIIRQVQTLLTLLTYDWPLESIIAKQNLPCKLLNSKLRRDVLTKASRHIFIDLTMAYTYYKGPGVWTGPAVWDLDVTTSRPKWLGQDRKPARCWGEGAPQLDQPSRHIRWVLVGPLEASATALCANSIFDLWFESIRVKVLWHLDCVPLLEVKKQLSHGDQM